MWYKSERDGLLLSPRITYPPRHKSVAVMSLIFISILGAAYIVYRSSSIFLTPNLTVTEPADGALLRNAMVRIAGKTEPKTRVTINGYEVYSDEQGAYAATIPFRRGYHVLDVRVENRVGKESRVAHHIVVQ